MAKKPAAVSLSVAIVAAQVLSVSGELVTRTSAGVVVRNKKPRSSKFQDTLIPAADLIALYTTEDGVTASYRANAEYDLAIGTGGEINDYGLIELETENGTVEINPAFAGVASADSEAGEEAEEKPAKGKTAAKGKDEEAEDEDYTPEVDDRIVVTDGEGEEFIGVVTKINAKSVTIQADDEETHTFKLADVELAAAPAKKAAKKPAAKGKDEEAEEKPGKGKAGKGKGSDDGEEW